MVINRHNLLIIRKYGGRMFVANGDVGKATALFLTVWSNNGIWIAIGIFPPSGLLAVLAV